MTEAEAEAAAPSAAALAAGAPPGPVATDLAGAYAALDLAEEEYVAGEAPAKVEVVQRIRRRCMGIVLMAEARQLYAVKKYEECLERTTEAKFCFRDADDAEKAAETDRFFSRAEGDRIMTNYAPELAERNYDKAMDILERANGCYELAHDPAAAEPFSVAEPRSVVAKAASKDGEKARRNAEKNLKLKRPQEARAELAIAEVSYGWAKKSLAEAGVPELYAEIVAFETKETAEATEKEAFAAFKRQDMPTTLELFEKSQGLFEKAGEAKTASDMTGVVTYLHQIDALAGVPPLAAESLADDILAALAAARPCMVTLASQRSTALRKWTGAASTALEHADISIKFFKLASAFEAKFAANKNLHLARKDLDQMSGVVRAAEAAVRASSWALPFPVDVLGDSVLLSTVGFSWVLGWVGFHFISPRIDCILPKFKKYVLSSELALSCLLLFFRSLSLSLSSFFSK